MSSNRSGGGDDPRHLFGPHPPPPPPPPRYVGYGPCPRCSKDVASGACGHSWRARSPDGNTKCGACGYIGPSSEWPK